VPKEAREEWSDRKKNLVAQLQGNHGSRQGRGSRCPAPSGQKSPNLDECRRAGENTPVACANMETLHCSLLGNSFRQYGAGIRDVDKTKSTDLIFPTITPDLCPTEWAGTIKENG
jgi:hypothetical protein